MSSIPTTAYGEFECTVEVSAVDGLHKTTKVENALLSIDGISQEFIDMLSWHTCKRLEHRSEPTYEAKAKVVWSNE